MNVRARIAPLLFIGAFASARIDAQQSVVIRDRGPGPVGRRVATALAGAHLLIPPAPTPAVLRRDSAYSRTVIVLQKNEARNRTLQRMADVVHQLRIAVAPSPCAHHRVEVVAVD